MFQLKAPVVIKAKVKKCELDGGSLAYALLQLILPSSPSRGCPSVLQSRFSPM